jgi:hypothetical protein
MSKPIYICTEMDEHGVSAEELRLRIAMVDFLVCDPDVDSMCAHLDSALCHYQALLRERLNQATTVEEIKPEGSGS